VRKPLKLAWKSQIFWQIPINFTKYQTKIDPFVKNVCIWFSVSYQTFVSPRSGDNPAPTSQHIDPHTRVYAVPQTRRRQTPHTKSRLAIRRISHIYKTARAGIIATTDSEQFASLCVYANGSPNINTLFNCEHLAERMVPPRGCRPAHGSRRRKAGDRSRRLLRLSTYPRHTPAALSLCALQSDTLRWPRCRPLVQLHLDSRSQCRFRFSPRQQWCCANKYISCQVVRTLFIRQARTAWKIKELCKFF